MENNYKIYLFLNPHTNGEFIYGKCSFNKQPFYVGKTCKKHRFRMHKNEALAGKVHTHKNHKLAKILRSGFNITDIVFIFKENLSSDEAKRLEIELIKTIGRLDLNEGPLTNATDGGEGMLNPAMSKRMTGKNNPMYGKNVWDMYDKKRTDEIKKKLSLSNSGKNNGFYNKKHTQETKEKLSKSHSGEKNYLFGKKMAEEHKKHIGEANIGKHSKPTGPRPKEYVEKHLIGNKNPNAKKFILISPNKNVFNINGNLIPILKSFKLNYTSMYEVLKERKPSFKGWVLKYDK